LVETYSTAKFPVVKESMGIVEGMNGLRDIIPELDKRFRYAVEVRDSSWFQDLAYTFFANNKMCMVWSQLTDIRTPPIVTTDFSTFDSLEIEQYKKKILERYKKTGSQK